MQQQTQTHHYHDTDELLNCPAIEIDLHSVLSAAEKITQDIAKLTHEEIQMDFAEPVPIKDMGTTLSGFTTVTTLSSACTEEQFKIYIHILELLPEWQKLVSSPTDLSYSRLKGNSNACFRVSLKETIITPDDSSIPRQLLYRRYEQTVVDKSVE